MASQENLVAKDRGNWSNPIEFILSCMNFAIGLGNVWRYPFLAYRNGGGAFLVPYLLAAFFIGLPIFFAELVIGQFSGLGPTKAFANLVPLFRGLGYCSLVVMSLLLTYYFVVIAWVFYYFYQSFFPTLLWGTCGNEWNTEHCFDIVQDIACRENNQGSPNDQVFFQQRCQTINQICTPRDLVPINATHCMNGTEYTHLNDIIHRVLSAEEFYYQHVLGIGDATWENFGYPRWQIMICLFLAWMLSGLCVIKGVASVGKIVYFTATFPYVILTALLVRGMTLPGSFEGVVFYITPTWEKLAEPSVWGDASSQIFYSFSLAFGALVTLASYNKFSNNCHFDATFVTVINYLTALYNGFVIFAILGFLAHQMDVQIDEVSTPGPGLSFIAFPSAILLMPGANVWAVLFFFMMIILGLGSTFAGVQLATTTIIDKWPHLRERQWMVIFGICFTGFLCGVPMTAHGGIFLFTLLERHTASWAVFIIGFFIIISLSWVHGINNTLNMVSTMGMKLWTFVRYYWKATWVVITPIYVLAIFVFVMTGIQPTSFRDYLFPVWADVLGWMFGASTLVPLVVLGIIELVKAWKAGDFKRLFKATEYWGPQEIDGEKVDRAAMIK